MEQIKLSDINIHDIGTSIQIAGTIWSGRDTCFVTLLPGKEEDLDNLKALPMELPEWETFLRQTDLLETEILSQGANGNIVKALYRKSQRQIDTYLQWNVFQRDHYTCRYCGRTGIPLTVDHIDLWEEGGATIEENLLTACRQCNKDRGNLHYGDWLKHDTYLKKSRGLTQAVKDDNEYILTQLPMLKTLRVSHVRSR